MPFFCINDTVGHEPPHDLGEADMGQEMQHHPAPSHEQAWHLAAQSLVVRQLLLQQAVESGLLTGTDPNQPIAEEEQIIDQLLQQDVSVPEADETTCQRFYDAHPDSFKDETSGKRMAFPQAKDHIRDYLHTKAMRIAVAEYIKALSYKADIKGFSF